MPRWVFSLNETTVEDGSRWEFTVGTDVAADVMTEPGVRPGEAFRRIVRDIANPEVTR